MRTNAHSDRASLIPSVESAVRVESMSRMPEPQQEHRWLIQFIGEWQAHVEMFMEPGKPSIKSEGTESVRAIGGFWIVGENKGSFMGKPFTGIFTLGYDTDKHHYVGTWIDSVSGHLWTYEGAVDAPGKVLTLEGEGTCPGSPGEIVKVKETIEFKNKNHRLFTSARQGADGKWVTGMIINYRRTLREGLEAKGHSTTTDSSHAAKAAGTAITITRVFDAPRELVFKAWTEPERMMRWWGPKGFTTPFCEIDLRPGGVFHNCMRSPEGRDYWSKGVYREVVVPERIVCTDYFSDEKGNQVRATQYGMSASWPEETLVTVTFAETGVKSRTRLTLRHDLGSAPEEERDMCHDGWSQSLDKLADELMSA